MSSSSTPSQRHLRLKIKLKLFQGCLAPVKIIVPKGSLLDPSDKAAVVGGNVLTSQRIVDVVFKAFRTCAASQGCMNNITFGNDNWGCYETVAGGSGAVSTFSRFGGGKKWRVLFIGALLARLFRSSYAHDQHQDNRHRNRGAPLPRAHNQIHAAHGVGGRRPISRGLGRYQGVPF